MRWVTTFALVVHCEQRKKSILNTQGTDASTHRYRFGCICQCEPSIGGRPRRFVFSHSQHGQQWNQCTGFLVSRVIPKDIGPVHNTVDGLPIIASGVTVRFLFIDNGDRLDHPDIVGLRHTPTV